MGGTGVLNPLINWNSGYVAGGGGGGVDTEPFFYGLGGGTSSGHHYGGGNGGGGGPSQPYGAWRRAASGDTNPGGGGGGGAGNAPTSPSLSYNRVGGDGGPGAVLLVVPDAHGFSVAPTVTMSAGYSVPGSKLAYKFTAGSGSIELTTA